MMKNFRFVAAAAISTLPASASAASAHAQLIKASPPVGGSAQGVKELRLTFSEAVEPKLSSSMVAPDGGAPVVATLTADAADKMALLARLPAALAPGHCVVTWKVTAIDTHRTQGSYAITVIP